MPAGARRVARTVQRERLTTVQPHLAYHDSIVAFIDNPPESPDDLVHLGLFEVIEMLLLERHVVL